MSRGATARLFVAVDPPEEVCGELAAWARAALGRVGAADPDRRERPSPAKVRVLDAETMHVTLCFLGGRPIGEIDAIAAALRAPPQAQGVELQVGAPLWLPPRRPRALALELHDRADALTRLHAGVRDAIAGAIDWQPERRRFRPHVTVARIGRGGGRRARASARRRGRSDADGAPQELALAPSPQLSFAVGELVLYRSLLSREGARYEAIATRALVESNGDSELSSSPPSPPSPAGAGVGFTSGGGQEGGEPSTPGAARKPPSHSGGERSSQA
ncbi:MAG TPA: RNA 2',3'-cyclic phosphodiesterase [Solirubrobacteraceae bacterium]